MDKTTIATLPGGDHRRLSVVTIFLASMAFLLVATSVAAFIYVTRKGWCFARLDEQISSATKSISENILRKLHLISVIIIILVELAFFIAVIICCTTHSKSKLHIVLTSSRSMLFLQIQWRRFWPERSLFSPCWPWWHWSTFYVSSARFPCSTRTSVGSLVEDILKDKVEPYPDNLSPFKSYEIQEVKSISSRLSAIPAPADEMAIPIDTPFNLTPFPRLPTPPELIRSSSTEKSTPISPTRNDRFLFEQESPHVVDLEKVRQGNLSL